MRLTDADGAEYFVSVPDGAAAARPVIVGVHGAGDRPDWSCAEWRAVTSAFAFVVCPRGFPLGKDAYAWGSAEAIALRAERALDAARGRFGDRMATGPVVYGGWSQGASFAARAIAASKVAFGAVVLVEIGHNPIDARAVASDLAKRGVTRAIVACSTLACRGFATEIGAARRRVDVRVVDVGLRGHYFDGPMQDALGEALPWLVEGDRRWER
jgi:hypothetical protein